MLVKNLSLDDYRNHERLFLEFTPGINIISGPNASGKTNIVEAMYYLSLARSFRGVEDDDLILKNKNYASIDSLILEGEIRRNIRILITKKGRQVLVNGKKVSRLSELAKCVNVLLFEPKDAMLFRGSPKERRNFLDINLSKRYPTYLDYFSNYEKALRERNEVLKASEVDKNLLDSTTELLIKYAEKIFKTKSTN